ncbi:MAG: hypothetical protein IPM74_09750 [Crocinitomicaceae bacterium]|nr:hypothetical protein [Crocinitomicaceae bacterium]
MKRFLTIAFFLPLFGIAQKAEMSIDTNHIRIGEQTVLRILFASPNPAEDALIGWPQYDEYLTNEIEIIDKTVDYESLIDSVNKIYRREQQLTISAFEPGRFTIPEQEITWNDSKIKTNPLELLVETVEVDTSKGIVDIKPIYGVEYSFSEMAKDWLKTYWYIFAGIAFIAAIFFLFRWMKSRKKDEPEPEKPKVPAHITALSVLHDLLNNEKWRDENKKEYYSLLTDTVRKYLEERFDIFAMEKTTREILADLRNADMDDNDKVNLKKILSQADMVKFAKFKPMDEDGYLSLQQSIDFVERTRIADKDETPAQTTE